MNMVILDFETYYDDDFNLRELTIPEYVADARFAILGLAVRHPDKGYTFELDAAAALERLCAEFGPNLEDAWVVCHNAYFDLYVLKERFGLSPAAFIDTLSLAYHVHGRRDGQNGKAASLKSLAERYGLQAKGDLTFMKGVRHPDATQKAELAAYACHDAELTHQIAMKLLPEVSRPGVELPILMHTVRLFTQRHLAVNQDGLKDLMARAQQASRELLEKAQITPEVAASRKDFESLLHTALARTGRLVPLKEGKNGWIPALAKTDPDMQELAEDDDPVVANLARAKLGLGSSNQLVARLATLNRITQAAGGLPPYLVYYGAHTGRFAGGGKFNLQNLGRSEGLAGQVRGLLQAAPGHVLVIGDMSQIECRVTAWYAGEDSLLEAFRDSRDIYSEFAGSTLGGEVRKPHDADSDDLRRQLKAKRQVGKQAVLGLGFGMGALKFINTLRKDPAVALLFEDGTLSPGQCVGIVKAFRQQYSAIPTFWRSLENAFREAVEGRGSELGPLVFEKVHDTVFVQLPSGRRLRYENTRLDATPRTILYLDEFGEEREFECSEESILCGRDTNLYGGKLCENIVQATARDHLVEAILDLEASGYPVLFHVHDEIVLEVPAAQAEQAQKALGERLNRNPAWAPGLPLASEVLVNSNYTKG